MSLRDILWHRLGQCHERACISVMPGSARQHNRSSSSDDRGAAAGQDYAEWSEVTSGDARCILIAERGQREPLCVTQINRTSASDPHELTQRAFILR